MLQEWASRRPRTHQSLTAERSFRPRWSTHLEGEAETDSIILGGTGRLSHSRHVLLIGRLPMTLALAVDRSPAHDGRRQRQLQQIRCMLQGAAVALSMLNFCCLSSLL
eukprot:TRINITY_DN34682_c0_g2_i3.p1 TRINITY_DN34682_c0_g2~~TRINITY_DN34682_c0_g2_i3.p1  ORF type:complete len:108 (-),score=5.99 TRINITY_DN34682_c0_g2_i3:175-498(-)